MLRKTEQFLFIVIDGVMATFFAVILLITIFQVCLRYGFNSSILGGGETMEGLFIYTTAIGAAVAVRRRRHVNIDFMVKFLPGFLQRVSDVLVHLLTAFFNGLMIFYSVAWIGKVGSHESPVLRIPEWTMLISIPIGCGLVIFFCLVNVLLTIRGEWPPGEDQA